MQISIVTLLALQAIGVIAAPVATPAADYADVAKANIIIKSAGTYKRDEEKRSANYADAAKANIIIKSAGTYKRGEEYADLAKDSIKIKSVNTY
ncbi:hypothetical protein LY78DRAFT_681341 [Colletotrichum sublineola]|uniref:Pectate lyase n=1 Tax=Colletotrichum sublineola TaxID=1173701 RepID=A0A066XSI2_COLSU|nr:hypothetical protein LY78DRAFT_681341 [Colletotrichum sublineola]KDN72168.1 hypothetical protein CSUB01_10695 [Colletotrichum sublineola]